MAKDIEAMRKLGMPDFKIRKELDKRRGLSKGIISDLMLGVYTPKRPSDFFITRTGEINRDLNKKEGASIPNPYIEALPTLNGIINKNRRIDLIDGDLSMSDLMFERTSPQTLSSMSNTNSIINSQITDAPPVLAASGTNQNLTRPVQLRDVFDDTTSIV